ncbi:hypothetical protein [Polaribacter sp. M15]
MKLTTPLIIILLVLNTIVIQAQSAALGGTDSNPNSQHLGTTAGIYVLSPKSKVNIKKVFLFDNFNNKAIIVDRSNKKFKITNFNIDLVSNLFVSKFKNDSLYTFTNINKAFVNNREYIKKEKYIYEKSVEGDKLNLYLKLFSKRKEKEFDKMNGKLIKPEHFVKKKEYIFENVTNNKSASFSRLKKKVIINLIDGKLKNQVVTFAKKNKLSFKRYTDLKKILNYYNKL